MNNNLNIAISAAISAGEAIIEIYNSGDFDVTLKGDSSPLTRADLKSQDVISSFLKDTGLPILSEEGQEIPFSERKKWDKLWVVDPIDGTKEFIKRNGEFTVNISLVENGLPVLGVIYVPVSRVLYVGEVGKGAWRETLTDDKGWSIENATKLPIEKSDRPYTVVASRSHLSPETQEFIDGLRDKHGEVQQVSKGSSLKLCMVAEGLADCYPRFAPTMEWDTAAGQAICMASGKDVIDQTTGETMRYNRENLLNSWFLVH